MKFLKLTNSLLSVLLILAVSSCSKKSVVPDDAKLVWQGILESPNAWKGVSKEDEGTLYLVEAKSGKVIGVRTIWKEKPNFTFTVDLDTEYQLYFRSEILENTSHN